MDQSFEADSALQIKILSSHIQYFKRCFAPKYVILYLRVLCFQRLLAIPRPASLGEVVHGGELNEGRKDESVADGYEPIHGCCIGHFRERVPGADAECGHGQHSGHPWVQTKAVTSLN